MDGGIENPNVQFRTNRLIKAGFVQTHNCGGRRLGQWRRRSGSSHTWGTQNIRWRRMGSWNSGRLMRVNITQAHATTADVAILCIKGDLESEKIGIVSARSYY